MQASYTKLINGHITTTICRAAHTAKLAGDAEQLKVCYEGVLKHNPLNVGALEELAKWHLERSSFNQARLIYQRLLRINETDPDVWINYGFCCVWTDMYDEALRSFGTANALLGEGHNVSLFALYRTSNMYIIHSYP
jgi:Tfp pilus assembly protein PilF